MLFPRRPLPPAKTFTITVSPGFAVGLNVVDVLAAGGAGGATGAAGAGAVPFATQGIGIHKEDALGAVGLAAVKPQAKPAVKVATSTTTRPKRLGG